MNGGAGKLLGGWRREGLDSARRFCVVAAACLRSTN
jgi:hypothetical protein